jgi:uncharacterized protein YceK
MSNLYNLSGPPVSGQPAPRKKKTGRILVIVGVSLVAVIGLLFAGCSALVSNINGGSGSHTEKAAAMVAAADRVPESDWTLLNRYNPKVDNGCLSIDTPCLKLSASWSVDYAVDPEGIANRMGLNMRPSGSSIFGPPCTSFVSSDGTGKMDICINESKDLPGSYQVDIFMTQR